MTKKTKRRITRLIAFSLTMLMLSVFLFPVFADNTFVPARIAAISDYKVYALKNKHTGYYLTPPDYAEVCDPLNPNNVVHQKRNGPNDQYSRALTITYSETNGLYTISSVLFDEFGEARITSGSTNDLRLTQNSNEGYAEWIFVYNEEQGAYRILNTDGEAISANISTESVYLTSEIQGNNQFWLLEELTVNPHLIKATENLEKKNIGNGCEWLFKLRDSEMATRNIISVEAVSNPSLVTISRNGNWFIVKINEYDNTSYDRMDNFALLKITLDGDEIRYILIQDAGSAAIAGCTSAPFAGVADYHSISQNYNECRELMLTFRSELGNISVSEWEIIDDFECVEIATYDDQQLIGTNYVVLIALKGGFVVIKATTADDREYSQVVEIIVDNRTNKYVIEIGDEYTSTYSFELQRIRHYLIKTENMYRVWDIAIDSELENYPGTLVSFGRDYAVITCESKNPVLLTATGYGDDILTVTATPAKGAIIIVPGIMASQIYADGEIEISADDIPFDILDDTIASGTRLWDPKTSWNIPDDLLANEKVNALAMNEYGTPKYNTRVNAPIKNIYYEDDEESDDDFQYGALNIYMELYHSLYNFYHDDFGYDIILYEYDWRYDPSDTADLLDAYITNEGYNDIIFVGHSMGGNVVSHYLTHGVSACNRVNKNISIGTPYLGAAQLLYVYMTGEAVENTFAGLVGFYDAVKAVIYNFPSVYSLLPSEFGFVPYLSYYDGANTEVILDTYAETINALSNYMPNWNADLFESSCENHNNLFFSYQHISKFVDSFYIVGDNISTTESVRLVLTEGSDTFATSNTLMYGFIVPTYTYSGDGTVSLNSALIGGSLLEKRVFYKINSDNFNAEHVEMAEGADDFTTIDFICDIIGLPYSSIITLSKEDLFTNYGIRYGE